MLLSIFKMKIIKENMLALRDCIKYLIQKMIIPGNFIMWIISIIVITNDIFKHENIRLG